MSEEAKPMKRKVKIWFPVWSTIEDTLEVEIPDGEDPYDWLYNNEQDIIESHHLCEIDVGGALDAEYAGIKFIDEETKEFSQGEDKE